MTSIRLRSSNTPCIAPPPVLRGAMHPGAAAVCHPEAAAPISYHPALERGRFAQALLDVAAIGAALLLIAATGLGTAAALFILFFVDLS